jgi:hypothetical protein
MAKNITILEGRETRTFGNVEKITTNLAGGGTQNWIPEDEAADYVDAEELSVDENGYYEPDPGTFYSGVDVNVEVEPDLEEITITENGTYTPQGDGFSSVSVEVDSSGSGDDPEVHGQEVSATATVDINAGDTVAIQDDSHEPVSVSCPLPDRFVAWQTNTPSALKFDGKFIYWIKYIDTFNREVRKKPLANIGSENFTVVGTYPMANGWGGVDPWYAKDQGTDDTGEYTNFGSVFTNKAVKVYGGMTYGGAGKAVSVYTSGTFDKALKKTSETAYSNVNNPWRMISGSRVLRTGHADGNFGIILLGGTETTYNVTLPQGVDTLLSGSVQAVMFAGNNVLYIGYDSSDSTNKKIIACPFDDAEYDQPRTSEASVVCDLDFSSFAIGSDTTFDRWAIATDNGLIVIRSDLSYDIYPAITSLATPYLIGDYVFLGSSCFKLTDDGAKMVPTSSKGTDGSLGVAKHNVRAGETGTAVVLFS